MYQPPLARKVLANENIPRSLVAKLKEINVDVKWLAETNDRGLDDGSVITLANRENRVILTRDRDFMRRALIDRVATGIIFLATPVTKDNLQRIARTVLKILAISKSKLAVIYDDHVELYNV